MANPPPKKCPRCSNTLAVAALNPQHLWCSICAVEFDLRAQELPENIKAAEEQAEAQIQAPAAVVTVRDAASAGAASSGLALPQVPVPQVPVLPAAQRGRLLTVTAGDLSFSASPPFTFKVGKTKVSVE